MWAVGAVGAGMRWKPLKNMAGHALEPLQNI